MPVRTARLELTLDFDDTAFGTPEAAPPFDLPPGAIASFAAAPGSGTDAGPTPVGLGDGSLIDLGAKFLANALKAALRRRGLITAVLVSVLLLGAAGTATAGGHCRDGGGNGRQGGPVRTAFQQVRENIQERRAARGCQLRTEAFPASPAVAGASGVVTYGTGSSCPNGVCPRQ